MTPQTARTDILTPGRPVEVAALDVFVATDFFIDVDQPDGIRFRFGPCFRANFLMAGSNAVAVPAVTLNVSQICRFANDSQIMAALGGTAVVKTSLGHLAQLIKAQPDGEPGDLFTSSRGNTFYAECVEGGLQVVSCAWYSDLPAWLIGSTPIDFGARVPWDQVFSLATSIG